MTCPFCGFKNQDGVNFCGKCGHKFDTGAEQSSISTETNPSKGVSTSTGFVGRQREMADLVNAFEDTLAGNGRLVMLVGEPGIGKTRTAHELAAIAEQRDAQVLWGRCYEGEGTPPYWPWIQSVQTYVQQTDAEQLRSAMDPGAADIAEIVPEVRTRFPDIDPAPSLEPAQARFRLFNSITTFLKNVAQTQPLVLVLDDLHWADRSSLLLLEFLAREMEKSKLLVIGTYRDVELSRQHPLSETLAELSREPLFRRVLLRGLAQEHVQGFVEITAGITPAQNLVDDIHAQTEGNPFFMTEMVRLLSEEGELTDESSGNVSRFRLPEGIREVIGQRLNRLSEECNRVLTIASVIGREFDFKLLGQVTDSLDDDLLDVIDEALESRVIENLPGAGERYQFSHALIRQTLVEELSTSRRVRLHMRVGEALEAMYGEAVEAHADELAHHFAEAEPVLGDLKLVRYSLMAGERALEAYAIEDALPHFQRALAAREGQTMDDQLAAIKFGIGRAIMPMASSPNEAQPAWDALSQAFDYYVEQGDVEKAVNVAIHHIPLSIITGVAELLARALELVPRESLQAGYLLERYAGALIYELDDPEGSRDAAKEAIAIARRENDEVLEANSLGNLVNPLWLHHQPHEAIEAGLKAVEIAQRIGNLQTEKGAQWVLTQVLLTVGEPDRARIHADAAVQAAEKSHDGGVQSTGLLFSAYCASYQGDWSKANELAGQAWEILPINDLLLGLKAGISLESDDVGDTGLLVDNLSGDPIAAIHVSARLIRAAYETNNNDFMDIGEATLIAGKRSINGLQSFWIGHYAAIVAALRKDTAAAAEHYAALAPDEGTALYPSLFSADHVLGLLAQTMGNLDRAQSHFEDAQAFCRKANYRPELGWILYDSADSLLQRNARGDRQKALSLLNDAADIARDLGMVPLIERVSKLMDTAQSRPARPALYPDGLTEREVEVLRLIATGKTDREIGEELFISVRTVGNHVRNILNKTTTANRTEAATYAAQHGLVS